MSADDRSPPTRRPTALDRLADDLVDRYAALDPIAATAMGLTGHDHALTDYSPEGHEARGELLRQALRELAEVEPTDRVDTVTADVMRERLGSELQLVETAEDLGALNVIASPVQHVREVFDITPTRTPAHRAVVVERLRAVPAVLDGYVEAVRAAARAGRPPARRQVLACADQCDEIVREGGFFAGYVGRLAGNVDTPPALAGELREAGRVAGQAYARLAARLRGEVLAEATPVDAVGRERYGRLSRSFLGDDVDLDDAYAWGIDEVRRLRADGHALARQILGRATDGGIDAAVAALDADARRRIEGREEFRSWMQRAADESLAALAGTQFDIPEPARRLDCRIAPTSAGAVYYTPPSDDFTRPGTIWWAVPEGTTSFSTWQHRTTVYHEGVPGHHLQFSAALLRSGELNRYRRLLSWSSGHGEGWALYAERLMAELGFLEDPGDRMGLVAAQLLRAARVVVDIGVHCELPAPEEAGGGAWTAESAWEYLRAMVPEPEPTLRYELDRYLGWPGQAPSYKLGERVWLQLRDEAARRPGFDPAAWHARALDLGSMGLASLRRALAGDGA